MGTVLNLQQYKSSGKLIIATAPSVWSKKWKNIRVTWDELTEKLKNPIRTKETLAEYDSLTKTERDSIKNVGGFVGGYVKDGERKKGNCRQRTLLTLDADTADDNFWNMVEIIFDGTKACIYSTRSDRPNNRRFRLVMPLDRPLGPDEYEAVSRQVAYMIGIDYFDETTFQSERLMYWGSCSSDQEYTFEKMDGVSLNTSEILGMYDFVGDDPEAWKDCSLWPTTKSVSPDKLKEKAKTQVDPMLKKGIIGAFCRTYSIQDAIDEFLSEDYEPFRGRDDRYTYKKGHTAGGLVVYENKFAYAHQNTDPSSGILCNAWDLVRIHLFGDSKEADKKMQEFAISQNKVKEQIDNERADNLRKAFENVTDDIDKDYARKLSYDKQDRVEGTARNIKIIFKNDPVLADTFKYDVFKRRMRVVKPLIWRNTNIDADVNWTDVDTNCLYNYFEERYGVTARKVIDSVFAEQYQVRAFHPVKEYLNNCALMWDGEKRAETLFIDYLGAEDNRYNSMACRKMLLAAVRRIFKPGCKFDTMCIFMGGQGIGKTTFVERLGGKWFTNSIRDVSNKDAYQQLDGNWIIEMGELATLKQADTDIMKNFMSKTIDSYRPAFGKMVVDVPRQCVFFGTCNDTNFLKDPSGGRRYWVVPCTQMRDIGGDKVFKTFTPEFVAQIWGEVMSWPFDEPLVMPADLKQEIIEREEKYSENAEFIDMIKTYLDTPVPTEWPKMTVAQRRDWIRSSDSDDFDARKKGTVVRDMISALEIYKELFANDDYGRYINLATVRTLLRGLSNWRYSGSLENCGVSYGRQRVFIRMTAADDLL